MAINFANNSSLANITTLPASISGGGLTLVSSQTASASASIEFTTGIDSTYDVYVFKFYDLHSSGGNQTFQFQASTNGGSSYGVTTTSTLFFAQHDEGDTYTTLSYSTGGDLAQSTSFQRLLRITSQDDNSGVGTLIIYNPSNTTFVKHYLFKGTCVNSDSYVSNAFVGGYFNTTSSLNAFQFKFQTSNIDDGIIKMYGVA
jgi:hypothetical protein